MSLEDAVQEGEEFLDFMTYIERGNKMEISNVFTMPDGDGKEEQYTALNMVTNPDTGIQYVLYTETENLKNLSGKDVNVYAAVYKKEDGQIVLEPVESENDWKLIQDLIDDLLD